MAVDGSDEKSYQMVRKKGSLKKVLDFIKNVDIAKRKLKSKTPRIGVVQIVTKFNENQIDDIKHLVTSIGANNFRTKNVRDFTFNKAKLSKYLPKNPVYNDYDDNNILKDKSKIKCYGPWNSIYIDVEGNVTTCCVDYDTTYRFGNVRDSNLIKIWKSTAFKKFRKMLLTNYKQIDICKRCIESRSRIK